MFDISWSELLILAVVTLLVVGPKDLPRFLGMLGRYAGVVRRQANEFRQVFDDAMREAELDTMRREFQEMQENVNASVKAAEKDVAAAARAADAPAPPQPKAPGDEQTAALPDPAEPSILPPSETPAAEPAPMAATPSPRTPAEPVG